jgi:hypothetical protein
MNIKFSYARQNGLKIQPNHLLRNWNIGENK